MDKIRVVGRPKGTHEWVWLEECRNLKNISKGFESQIDAEIDRVHRLLTEPELNFE